MDDPKFEGQLEVLTKVFAGKTREELLVIRGRLDEVLGYKEFVKKLFEEGIVL